MAVITNEMRHDAEQFLSLDYDQILKEQNPAPSAQWLKEFIDEELSLDWIELYQMQCAENVLVLSVVLGEYTFLWDQTYERVVAVYGVPNHAAREKRLRDKPRIAYYFRNFVRRHQAEAEMDTGHFIAHSLGGGLDMNLFPQKRAVNRGQSVQGKQYRKMENYALKNPGTLIFSRPIYFDDSWRPFFLEYGVLKTSCDLWTHIFDNI